MRKSNETELLLDSASCWSLFIYVCMSGFIWSVRSLLVMECNLELLFPSDRLSAQRKYFFEVIHHQNDKGTDHVEVAVSSLSCFSDVSVFAVARAKRDESFFLFVFTQWKLLGQGLSFVIIESEYISLYVGECKTLRCKVVRACTIGSAKSLCKINPLRLLRFYSHRRRATDESALLLSDVAHIPQTAASHQHASSKRRSDPADALNGDPRDTLYSGESQAGLQSCFLLSGESFERNPSSVSPQCL